MRAAVSTRVNDSGAGDDDDGEDEETAVGAVCVVVVCVDVGMLTVVVVVVDVVVVVVCVIVVRAIVTAAPGCDSASGASWRSTRATGDTAALSIGRKRTRAPLPPPLPPPLPLACDAAEAAVGVTTIDTND